MTIQIETMSGQNARSLVTELAALRIMIFRDFPYLYDGDFAYEKSYLETYFRSERSLFVLAKNEGRIVGASTAIHLQDETPAIQTPLQRNGYELKHGMYFGESILRKEYRGQGVGRSFFKVRDDFARTQRCQFAAFCAVIRPATHPLKPSTHRGLEPLWSAMGFQPLAGVTTTMTWRDIGQKEETEKSLQFWTKKLS